MHRRPGRERDPLCGPVAPSGANTHACKSRSHQTTPTPLGVLFIWQRARAEEAKRGNWEPYAPVLLAPLPEAPDGGNHHDAHACSGKTWARVPTVRSRKLDCCSGVPEGCQCNRLDGSAPEHPVLLQSTVWPASTAGLWLYRVPCAARQTYEVRRSMLDVHTAGKKTYYTRQWRTTPACCGCTA